MRVVTITALSSLLHLADAQFRLKAADPFLPPNNALPYANRGIKLWQIEAFAYSYALGAGAPALEAVCTQFNKENHARIHLPPDDPDFVYPCKSKSPQAYDMVWHLIAPLTNPDTHSEINAPAGSNWTMPRPERNMSVAELLNPDGFPDGVDAFMTWSWEAEISEVVTSLRRHAESIYMQVNKSRPEDVVFWICAFVINQHQVDDELNWDLSMQPFRLGLEHAKGAIMLLNDYNYSRVLTAWNYYEVLVCFVLSKQLWPIGSGVWSEGSTEQRNGVWGGPSTDVKMLNVEAFNISQGIPDYRTGATDADLQMILELIGTTQLGVDGLSFRIRSLLASAMTYYAMAKVVDASALLNHPTLRTNLPAAWTSTQALFPFLQLASSTFDSLLAAPVSMPECRAEVPHGLRMHLLSGTRVRRHDRILHQTEVVVNCSRSDATFLTSCNCNAASPDDTKGTCTWSSPRPRGEKGSCWPAHNTGELDCKDHPPLDPLNPGYCEGNCATSELKDLVCDTAAGGISV